jgi:hypothetical protein
VQQRDPKDIEIGNLRGEVVVLRELVRMLVEQTMPFDPMRSGALQGAAQRARAAFSEGSPDRISVDHAINMLQLQGWTGKQHR